MKQKEAGREGKGTGKPQGKLLRKEMLCSRELTAKVSSIHGDENQPQDAECGRF